jgi:hypothetical protein
MGEAQDAIETIGTFLTELAQSENRGDLLVNKYIFLTYQPEQHKRVFGEVTARDVYDHSRDLRVGGWALSLRENYQYESKRPVDEY